MLGIYILLVFVIENRLISIGCVSSSKYKISIKADGNSLNNDYYVAKCVEVRVSSNVNPITKSAIDIE